MDGLLANGEGTGERPTSKHGRTPSAMPCCASEPTSSKGCSPMQAADAAKNPSSPPTDSPCTASACLENHHHPAREGHPAPFQLRRSRGPEGLHCRPASPRQWRQAGLEGEMGCARRARRNARTENPPARIRKTVDGSGTTVKSPVLWTKL